MLELFNIKIEIALSLTYTNYISTMDSSQSPQQVVELTVVTAVTPNDDLSDDSENVCCICLEEMVAIDKEDIETGPTVKVKSLCKLKCGHEYHFHCITPVVVNSFLERKDVICPFCRNVECSRTTSLYRQSYRSLIDLVRQEGRHDILQVVRMDVEDTPTPTSTPTSNNNVSIRHNITNVWIHVKYILSSIPLLSLVIPAILLCVFLVSLLKK